MGAVFKKYRALVNPVQAVGLHPEKGNSIWEVYRETELMIDDEAKKEKVISIFRRQCRLPLYELEGTYKEFKAFDQAAWKAAKPEYDAAVLSERFSSFLTLQSMFIIVNTKSVDKYTLCSNVLTLFRASVIAIYIFCFENYYQILNF